MRIISIFVALVVLLMASASQASTLFPFSIYSKTGSISEQSLHVLSVKDQSASDDDASKYIEIIPARGGYDGVFRFNIPPSIDISSLVLNANFRGPERDDQRWRFMLLSNSGKWITVADNRDVDAWSWSDISKRIKNPSRFINDKNQITLRYKTHDNDHVSQLDYLAIVTTSPIQQPVDVVLTPVPTTKPTQPETPAPSPKPISGSGEWVPGLSWQIQYTGKLDTSLNVDVYNIDLFDTSAQTIAELKAAGKRVICYFSAGSHENWRPDAESFPASVLGRSLDGWAGEKWLDIRQLDILIPIMQARMKLAAEKGCNGVDPDNVDGYSNNTGFPLNYNDQLTYNIVLAETAHDLGLAIGLKNDVDQIKDLANHFDFAVNEECYQYGECDRLKPFINAGKAVFGIEYNLPVSSFCKQANESGFKFLKKQLDLNAWRQSC